MLQLKLLYIAAFLMSEITLIRALGVAAATAASDALGSSPTQNCVDHYIR